MGKAVRKNAKWFLLDDPEDLELDHQVPRRTRALRARKCNTCGDTISAGEEHLMRWAQTDQFYPMRVNICCLCSIKEVEREKDRLIKTAVFMDNQLKCIHKYIKDKNLAIKRMVERDL